MIDQGLDSYYHQYAYQLSRPLKLVSHSYVTIMHSKQGVDILMPAINVREVINKIQKRINGIVSHGAGNAFFFLLLKSIQLQSKWEKIAYTQWTMKLSSLLRGKRAQQSTPEILGA